MMVRDDFDAPVLGGGRRGPAGEFPQVDFSPEAIRQGLEEEAGDDSAAARDRVNSCLMLAGIDFSHGRYDRAIQQYTSCTSTPPQPEPDARRHCAERHGRRACARWARSRRRTS